jgi:hypothetical protein
VSNGTQAQARVLSSTATGPAVDIDLGHFVTVSRR